MNNRGQVLTFFVLMLPIFVVLLILTIDISNLIINKLEVDNINRILVDYALDKMEEDNLNELVTNISNLNDSDIEVNLSLEDNRINLILKKEVKGIISKQNIYNLKSNFLGYIDNEKKIIQRVKG